VIWKSKLQTEIATSTLEGENDALSISMKEVFQHIIAVAIFSLQMFEILKRSCENSIEFRRITN